MRQILNSLVLPALALVFIIAVEPVAAQNAVTDGDGTAELETLPATHENNAKRETFVKQLRALIAAQRATVAQTP
jgi:hypothetical protein